MKNEMITNIILIVYSLFLVILAIGSSFIVYAKDATPILALELAVDITLIAGVILYVRRYQFSWWRVLFVGAVVGECYLLFTEPTSELLDTVIWVLILLPAFVVNLSVASLTRQTSRRKNRAADLRR